VNYLEQCQTIEQLDKRLEEFLPLAHMIK